MKVYYEITENEFIIEDKKAKIITKIKLFFGEIESLLKTEIVQKKDFTPNLYKPITKAQFIEKIMPFGIYIQSKLF